jgi:hypothetical protein
MTEISKYNQFINEIYLFEWERTILDRNDRKHKYLDANYEPIPLLRLPKYNQLNGSYEKFITKLRSDAYNEILLFENYKIEKVLYRLQEIKIEFKEFWEIWKKIFTSLANPKVEFNYSEIVSVMYLKFGIIDFNNSYLSNGLNGSFGLITNEFKYDLYDALILKDRVLNHLIYDLKKYLKAVETPAPAEQKGFDLGLTEPQLKALHKELIDKTFLAENTKQEYFINAFNGKVLENFEPLNWIDKTAKNNAPFNTQTILEFLYLSKMDESYYDTLPSNQNNFYRLIERIFASVRNIQAKNTTKAIQQKTERQRLLQNIINSIKL